MKYTDLFADITDFRTYAEGLQNDTTYLQLMPAIRAAGSEVSAIITHDVYAAISSAVDMDEPLELLRTAVATLALYKYQIFSSVKKNGSDASLYKYQHEELKDFYIDAHWKAVDALLDWLDANPTTGGFDQTPAYADRQSLPLKNALQFDRYFGINRSSYFFSKVQYLIRQCWGKILPKVRNYQDNEDIMEHARRALCYMVMARVVMQFDVTEFPRSLRWDYNHEYTHGSSVPDRGRLAGELSGTADAEMAAIDTAIRLQGAGSVETDHNREENKFFHI